MTGRKNRQKLVDAAIADISTLEVEPHRASRTEAKPSDVKNASSLVPPKVGQGRRAGAPSSIAFAAAGEVDPQLGRTNHSSGDKESPPGVPTKQARACRKVTLPERPASPNAPERAGQDAPRRGRREQRRAIETKQAILGAALQEFARKGFDAASIRDIADLLGIQHPLITYHYRTKELLWQAVAEQIVSEVKEEMESRTQDLESVKPRDRVRAEFRALLHIQHKYPYFHHFMLNESRDKGPRLRWLAQNVLAPMVNQNLPEIRRAQAAGDLPAGEPVLLHYMLIGMTSALMSLSAEIDAVTGYAIDGPGIEDAYFDLIDQVMFKRKFLGAEQDQQAGTDELSQIAASDHKVA